MKKSNTILLILLALVSVFLLWLWYFFGFNHIDEPLDLVLSIVWWVVIVLAIIAIGKVEKKRRERIRTVYVSEDSVFNGELGSLRITGAQEVVPALSGILHNLRYSFEKQDLTCASTFPVKWLIRTFEYKSDAWKGEIVEVGSGKATAFDNEDELKSYFDHYQSA